MTNKTPERYLYANWYVIACKSSCSKQRRISRFKKPMPGWI